MVKIRDELAISTWPQQVDTEAYPALAKRVHACATQVFPVIGERQSATGEVFK